MPNVQQDMNAPVSQPAKLNVEDNDSDSTFKMVMDLFEQAKKARSQYDQDWDKQQDFYDGKQWSEQRPKYRSCPVNNMTSEVIQGCLPILTDTDPTFTPMPREPGDYDFADTVGKITNHWWAKPSAGNRMRLVEVLEDAMIMSYGVKKITWDEKADFGAGEIISDIKDPRNIFVSPEAIDFNVNNKYVIERIYKTVGEWRMQFPDQAANIRADDSGNDKDKAAGVSTDITLVSPTDQKASGKLIPPKGQQDDRRMAMGYECWLADETMEEYAEEKDDGTIDKGMKKKYPKGRLITILPSQKITLQDIGHPYKHGKFPYVRYVDMVRPRKFNGRGEVERLMSMNRAVNKTLANILDYMNLTSNPVWITEKGNGVNADKITNSYGLVLTVNEGKRDSIKREIPPPLPQYVFEFYRELKQDLKENAGVDDITQGRKPTGVTAGTAIETLQDAAQTRIRLKERNMQVSLAQEGEQVIQLMFQFYTSPRVVRITGKQGVWQEGFEYYFQPAGDDKVQMVKQPYQMNEQTGQPESTGQWQTGQPTRGLMDLEVTSGTAMPWAKSQKANLAMSLFDKQAIDQQALLESVEFPDADQIMKRMQEAAAQQAAMAPVEPIPNKGANNA